MRRLVLLVLVAAALFYGTGVFGQQPRPPVQPRGVDQEPPPPGGGRGGARGARGREQAPATGTAVIRGRVVAADTGTPVRRATVQATLRGQRSRAALTDANGVFELQDLPSGTWNIRAAKAGFVEQQYGQRGPFSPSLPVELGEGERFTADFALMRGGAIMGRVFDEFGDPVANARLSAQRVQATSGGRRLVPVGAAAMSDDTGQYRLFGLSPGEYYVSAAAVGGSGALLTSEGPVTYTATYFPGTSDLTSAQRIAVGPGQEQPNINFTLSAVRAARVSGVVLGANGTPVQATVTLNTPMLPDGLAIAGRVTRTGNDGTFTIPNVGPGAYTLDVASRQRSPDALPDVASLPITVSGGDVAGLTITTSRGAAISGTIAAADATPVDTSRIRVVAPPMRPEQGARMPRAQAGADGSFELDGLIGPHSLRVEQLPPGWMVDAIVANGVDVTDLPIDFRGTERVSARVTLTNRIASIAGTVGSDRAVAGGSVLVFPDDASKWTFISRYVRTARLGEKGEFSIAALPANERYLAVALDYLEAGEHLDPAFLERVKPAASSFSLTPGEQKRLDLTMILRP